MAYATVIILNVVAGLLTVFLLFVFRKRVLSAVRTLPCRLIGLGLRRIYGSADHLKADFERAALEASSIRLMGVQLLLLVDRKEMRASLLGRLLEDNEQPNLRVQLLVLSPSSRYVGVRAAEVNHPTPESLAADIRHTIEAIRHAQAHHPSRSAIDFRLHRENPTWSIALVDDQLFLSFYLEGKRRYHAPAILIRGSHSPLYKSFSKYFDTCWDRSRRIAVGTTQATGPHATRAESL